MKKKVIKFNGLHCGHDAIVPHAYAGPRTERRGVRTGTEPRSGRIQFTYHLKQGK